MRACSFVGRGAFSEEGREGGVGEWGLERGLKKERIEGVLIVKALIKTPANFNFSPLQKLPTSRQCHCYSDTSLTFSRFLPISKVISLKYEKIVVFILYPFYHFTY